MPLTLTRAGETSRAYPYGNRVHHQGSLREVEVDKEKSQRKRISVACSRCRKRKIKCSGDLGNGQGCQNCKTAGADPSQCQFLRVNSQPAGFGTTHFEWPYVVNNFPGAPPLAGHLAMAPYYAPAPVTLSSSTCAGPVRGSRSMPTAYPYIQPGSQEHFGPPTPPDAMESYGYHAPAAPPFSAPIEHHPPPAMYSGPESLKPWPAVLPSQRAASIAWDADLAGGRFARGGLGPGASGPAEPPGAFAAMNGLISAAMSDRMLPEPRATTGVAPAAAAAHADAPHAFYPDARAPGPAPWLGAERGWASEAGASGGGKASASPSDSALSDAPAYGSAAASSRAASHASPAAAAPTRTASPQGLDGAAAAPPPPASALPPFAHPKLGAPGAGAAPTAASAAQYAYTLGGRPVGGMHPGEGTLLNGRAYTGLAERAGPPATQAGSGGGFLSMGTGRRDEMEGVVRTGSAARAVTATR